MDQEGKIKEIIAEHTVQPKFNLTDRLDEDLDVDSVMIMAMIIKLEDEFRLEIDNNEASGLKTVQDVINLIKSKSLPVEA